MYKYAMALEAIPRWAQRRLDYQIHFSDATKKCWRWIWTTRSGAASSATTARRGWGEETPNGQAFLEFQRYVKRQKDIGVLLTVCSKNDPENALAGLPPSPIRRCRPTIFRSSAPTLGTEGPQHCGNGPPVEPDDRLGRVRRRQSGRAPYRGRFAAVYGRAGDGGRGKTISASSTATPILRSLPCRPTTCGATRCYKRTRCARGGTAELCGLFRLSAFAGNAGRNPPFLANLYAAHRAAYQQINQFNLTTKALYRGGNRSGGRQPDASRFYGRLTDRFGDNGVVAVVIGEIRGSELHIDLWLMSCRVLKRDMGMRCSTRWSKRPSPAA